MYIKHLIGSRRGDTEDLPFTLARDKVLKGEAEDVYDQLHLKSHPKIEVPEAVVAPEVVSNRVDATITEAKVKGRRK